MKYIIKDGFISSVEFCCRQMAKHYGQRIVPSNPASVVGQHGLLLIFEGSQSYASFCPFCGKGVCVDDEQSEPSGKSGEGFAKKAVCLDMYGHPNRRYEQDGGRDGTNGG